jgi:hypothetical protein
LLTTTTRRAVVALAVWALALAVTACTHVVDTANDRPATGFSDVTVTTPSTEATNVPASTLPASTGGATGGAGTTVPGGGTMTAGECLTWDQSATNVVFQLVDCSQSHLVEVAGTVDLSASFGATADFPTTTQLQQVAASACAQIVSSYLGRDPRQDEQAGVIPPSTAAWSAGLRSVVCTIGLARQNGQRPSYQGRLADRR